MRCAIPPSPTAALLTLAMLGAASAGVRAGTPAARLESVVDPALEERVSVRLAEITILATLRDKSPVRDLSKEEIRVQSGGQDFQIAYLEALEESYPAGTAPRLKLSLEDREGAPLEIATPATHRPRHFIVLVDVENDALLERDRALIDLRRFLDQGLEPHDRIAVFAFDGALHLELSFTTDRPAAVEAATRAYARPPRPSIVLERRVEQLLEQISECAPARDYVRSKVDVDRACVTALVTPYVAEGAAEARAFWDALDTVITYAAGQDGAGASVIAITHGVTLDRTREFAETLRAVAGDTAVVSEIESTALALEDQGDLLARTAANATREGVALSFIDRSRVPSGAISARRGTLLFPGYDPLRVAFEAPRDAARLAALETGGVFIDNRDLGSALAETLAQERGRYRVGFYLPEGASRRDFDRARVDVRRAGVVVRQGRPAARIDAVVSPPPADARIAIGRSKPLQDGSGRFVPFALVMAPGLLGHALAGDEARAAFTVHLVVQDAEGRDVVDAFRFLTHSVPAEAWRAEHPGMVSLEGWLEAPPGSYRLRARVRPARGPREFEIVRILNVSAP